MEEVGTTSGADTALLTEAVGKAAGNATLLGNAD